MTITYDKQADASYIYIKKGSISYTKQINDWLMLDCDKKGDILGIEILGSEHKQDSLAYLSQLLSDKKVLEECRKILEY